jgi:hypothetical protein
MSTDSGWLPQSGKHNALDNTSKRKKAAQGSCCILSYQLYQPRWGFPKNNRAVPIAPHLPVEEYRLCLLAKKLP